MRDLPHTLFGVRLRSLASVRSLAAFVLSACAADRVPAAIAAPPLAQSAAPCPAPPSSPSSAAPALAQSQVPSPPDTFDVAAIDAYITRQMEARGFVGLSVAIVKDGALVLEKGYGRSELAPDVPVQTDTPFLVASITKQFVSAVVLQLAAEKKLSVDDKVAKYFPELTRAGDITLYDLMTHVSGYRDFYPLFFVDREMSQPIAPDETIARYAKRPLDFEPRTRFSYSGTGYTILGRVIEKVTGKPLGVVLGERILRPLGMAHSYMRPTEATVPGLARGYTSFALGPAEPATPEAHGWWFGTSGLYAPAGDIARWDVALMSGKVLRPEAYELFTTPRRLADGRTTNYGCGIFSSIKGGELVLQHDGMDSGFAGLNYMLPRTRSAVVILSNRDDAPPWDLVTEIAGLLNAAHRPSLKVEGLSVVEVAKEVFAAIQAGRVERSRFGDDFNFFLTEAKLKEASSRLRPLGDPTRVDVEVKVERGGMEQSNLRFTFGSMKFRAIMLRSLDGKVQQFLIYNKL
jgi:CubicO group peptidase (beta-lactamase class C family)